MFRMAALLRPGFTGVFILCALATVCGAQSGAGDTKLDHAQMATIRTYISGAWDTLTRSMTDCKTLVDPKLAATAVQPILYLPAGYNVPESVKKMQQQDCSVQVKNLPMELHGPGEVDTNKFEPHGVLYLEHPYVVPGGRFNEMYGWDSYFIVRGLVRDGRTELARGMVENFFFEIEHYGTMLNANRTYYLTRSQPPFLTRMAMAVYDSEKAAGKEDKAFLERAYGFASKDYAMWTRAPHLAGDTGLSRYFDFGEGPVPEGRKDEGKVHRKAVAYLAAHPDEAGGSIEERKPSDDRDLHDPNYVVEVCDQSLTMERAECDPKTTVHLTRDFYKGDRAMRESGFDISFRFGPFGAATHHFAPVCLNSLLYKTEKDLEEMAGILGNKKDAKMWHERAEIRAKKMQELFWDAKRGQFFDFNFDTGKRSEYQYASTFYPLWTGWATPEQARAVQGHLSVFELAGGIVMSPFESGAQWDFPYGWAPLQLIAVEGLRNYKFDADADRVSRKFLSTVLENFQRDGTIREKYNMVTRSTQANVSAGYQINVIGFGWTNGVFLTLADGLKE